MQTSSSATIRSIVADDWSGWRVLWDGYLRFYREELPEDVTRSTFDRLCEQRDEMFGFVAEGGRGELVGIVHALLHSSTWTTASYCYLEDLFVDPETRGTPVARELIEAVTAEAGRRGADKVYWHTQEFNGRARSLYDQVAKRVSFVVYERELP
ncbi:MAG: GNAT family N-acetyltransferase [Acidimicrobiales bacterium]